MALLDIQNIGKRFGGLQALSSVALDVAEGEIRGLIGPNGAGKTSLMNVITGVYRPDQGAVRFGGKDLTPLQPHQIARLGIARTFQIVKLFPEMTVLENVQIGLTHHARSGPIGVMLGLPRVRAEEESFRASALDELRFAGLGALAHRPSQLLPPAQQRILEIARTLATRPRLILLDEPGAGMNPTEKEALKDLIRRIAERGISVLLIEHDMNIVMPLVKRVAVLEFGQKIADGTPDEVQANPEVIRAYLGGKASA